MANLQAALLPVTKTAKRLVLPAAGAFNEDDRRCVVAASGATGTTCAPLVKSFSSPAATGAQLSSGLPRSSTPAPLGAGPGGALWHLSAPSKPSEVATARVQQKSQADSQSSSPPGQSSDQSLPTEGSAASSSQFPPCRDEGDANGLVSPAQFTPQQEGMWHMMAPVPFSGMGMVPMNFFLPIIVQPALAAGGAGCDQGAGEPHQQFGQVLLVPQQVAPACDMTAAASPSSNSFAATGAQQAPVLAGTGRTGASRRQRKRLRANAAAESQRQSGMQPAANAAASELLLGGGHGRSAAQPATNAAAPVQAPESEPEPTILWPSTPESTPPSSPRAMEAWAAAVLDSSMEAWSLTTAGSAFDMPVWQAGTDALANTNYSAVPTSPMDDEKAAEYSHLLQQLSDASQRPAIMDWVTTEAWPLASSPGGCRVVQKALEVADGPRRMAVAEQLHGRVWEASLSPHANHVLQKCVEVLPPDRIDFVISEMRGHAVAAARHRYGCRVLERVIEHCPAEQTEELVQEVLSGASQLCRHTFGNFVIQHILEHGTQAQRHSVAEVLHADIQRLARHRVASYVVRSALAHCAPEDRQWLVQTMKADAMELADLTHHHCGSFVVREMRRGERSAAEASAAYA